MKLSAGSDAVPATPPDADDVRVEHTSFQGDSVAALIEASAKAAPVVVGRRRADCTGPSLGSVSRALVQHAHCPVFLVG